MRIGIFAGDGSLDDLLELAKVVESDGFDSLWLPQIFGIDALCAHTLIGHAVPRIELGTAVVPTYPRHPAVLASQALTVSAASGGRFTLGIGLSHQLVIEDMYGYSFDKPIRHMREYLTALVPLVSGEAVDFEGETLTAKVALSVPGATPVPVLVAALGPAMLRLAAERTGGTITWMTGPKTLAEHTVPTITKAAEAAGTGDMRVVGALPAYRAMLDREGAAGPEDVALIGSAAEVRAGIERMRDAGVTDFVAVEFNTEEPIASATRDVLKEFV